MRWSVWQPVELPTGNRAAVHAVGHHAVGFIGAINLALVACAGVLNRYRRAPWVTLNWVWNQSPWVMKGVLIFKPTPAAQPHLSPG